MGQQQETSISYADLEVVSEAGAEAQCRELADWRWQVELQLKRRLPRRGSNEKAKEDVFWKRAIFPGRRGGTREGD